MAALIRFPYSSTQTKDAKSRRLHPVNSGGEVCRASSPRSTSSPSYTTGTTFLLVLPSQFMRFSLPINTCQMFRTCP
jgi:hypothetical protein